MRLIVLLAGACGAAPTPVVANQGAPATKVPVQAPCPSLDDSWWTYDHVTFAPWTHELFPGCSPAPFAFDFSVCNGTCPRPCAQAYDLAEHTRHATYRYDQDGNWIETTSENDPYRFMDPGSCTYRDGRIATCNVDSGGGIATWTIVRGGNGRIVALVDPHGSTTAVHWSPDGSVVTMIDKGTDVRTELRYDARKRLVSEQYGDMKTVWTYGDDGRVRRRDDDEGHTTYAYDDRGRLIAVDFHGDPSSYMFHGEHTHEALDYDAADRLVRETYADNFAKGSSRTYDYRCATMP